ncbi:MULTISPECIES: DMT family transporter [Halomonadaceae]|uniref:Threonine/homoserine efflux transporter RhtA n=1 Tax=Vreelandella aquamarina TaxID=77097 RepID=A0A0D7UZ09_9GAMM|nr:MULTISPECIES: DMT family transporter [Halomonas]MED5557319.1 DMT family transporter [Pseudomonadota bacterium]HBN60499.1 EamA/RhaT family transporter [Halomonas sp.]KJD19840.1 permease [Halomonas meridiana]MCC4286440.1 DMT family transporter [Halomonas meridiana]MDC8442261.1 DMT family transporter [Halomonas aquamarina]
MNSVKQAPWQADALLLLVTALAAGGWIFSKEALAGMPPLLFIGTRFLLAGLILLGFAWPTLTRMPLRRVRRGLLVGVLFSAAIAFWVLGLNYSDHLGESAFINSLGILLVPVVARLLFGDRPPRSTWVALPVALLGFALLSLNAGFNVEASQLLMVCAALCFALLINVNARVVRNVPALPLTTLQLISVGVVLTGLSLVVEHQPLALSPSILGWFMTSVLLASSLRFFLQIKAQSMTTPSHAAVILMLEAVWTALFAAWWFGETMTALQLLGCSLIFMALLINRWYWVRKVLLRWLPGGNPSR